MRPIDADALKKDIARLHSLNDEAEIRRAYASNPHSTMTDFEDTMVSVFDAIDDAPTIDAVREWVPCEERLPIEGETVLLGDSCGNFIVGRLIRTDYNYKWDIPFFTAWMDFGCWDAWMPLPAPYKEDKDDA